MTRFKDKVAIVTGGGGGIGSAICRRLADEGAIVIVTDMNAEAAGTVAKAICDAGGTAFSIPVDISDGGACAGLVGQVIRENGRIDVLINNADINRQGNLLSLS